MKVLPSPSLRVKIIVSIIVIATLFLGLFQGYIYYALNNQLLKELNTLADQKIDRLARDLDLPMWELDEIWMEKILKNEMLDKQVHAIYITGDENIALNVDADKSIDKDKDKNVIVRSKSISHNGVKIGEIKLYLTKELMKKRLFNESIKAILFTFIEIIAIILFLWIMIRRVLLRPIEALMKSTKRIAEGDYTYEALNLDNDEIGALGESIYQMKSKIQTRERELNLSNLELKEIKERFEYAVNGTQDGLWDWHLETNEVYFSPRWKEMLGYHDDELPNALDTWNNLIHPDDIEKAQYAVRLSHQTPGIFYENMHRLRHKNGSWVWILARGQTIFNEEGKAIRMVGFHTDITKQKELEEELLKQEEIMIAQSRHVAMGEMIGMIAHQWRQPITVIAMGANNMLVDIALDELNEASIKHEAQDILKQTEYLSKTIDDFRNFFRPNKDKEEVNVVDVLLEAKQIMGKSLENHNIELSITEGNCAPIFTYSRELLQVFLNLIKNAKEALEEKKIENAYIKVIIEDNSDSVLINVCDNAGGIDKAIIGRIFEPYFTTKDKKTGTGLGLYMSKTIIEKHLHGALTAMNTEEGACIMIRIPKEFKEEHNHE